MKIAILTQPLHNNYGGLLQAFALQYYIMQQGHDVITIDFSSNRKPRFWGIKSILMKSVQKYLFHRPIHSVFPRSDAEERRIGQHTNRFTANNIKTTQKIYSISEFDYIKKYNFDVYIVGSDQVWRPAYSPGIEAFFLSFLEEDDNNVKRIAYAASFGVDHCDEFSASQLHAFSKLLQKFDSVSVREDSAVTLCENYFKVKAEHVIDPTLLLNADDYCRLIAQDVLLDSDGDMMVYVLDKSIEKQKIINHIASVKGMTSYEVISHGDNIYPPVTQWLKGFRDAKYVITDSFHGVVFSIIFNKPFIAIGNHDRGLARFMSVLNTFGLNDRLVFNLDDLNIDLINSTPDFKEVNRIKLEQQNKAKCFLMRSLNNI